MGILNNVLTLIDEVKHLNSNTTKLADKVDGIDKVLVRSESLAEVAKVQAAIASPKRD